LSQEHLAFLVDLEGQECPLGLEGQECRLAPLDLERPVDLEDPELQGGLEYPQGLWDLDFQVDLRVQELL